MDETPNLAVVVGVAGGVGGALASAMAAQGRYDAVVGIARHRPSDWPAGPAHPFLAADITAEAQVAEAARRIGELGRPVRIVVATGLLHGEGVSPEKNLRMLDPEALMTLFRVNAVAPALIAKHLLPLTPRDRISVFAALSARVGSISDNRLGGWYGYRASKAALNMLIATLAIEQRRTRPQGICVALHPGTVETRLSDPFRHGASSAPKRLAPEQSAAALLDVMDGLAPEQSGRFFAWDGRPIPW